MKIFAFWHDINKIPGYIKLCLTTWKKFIHDNEVVIVDYSSLKDYTDIQEQDYWKELVSGKYPLAMISDVLRIDLLSNNGGAWMDIDSIVTSDDFEKTILNCETEKENTVFSSGQRQDNMSFGFMCAKKESKFIQCVKQGQIARLRNPPKTKPGWDYMCYPLAHPYLRNHKNEFRFLDAAPTFVESFNGKRGWNGYREFWFRDNHSVDELKPVSSVVFLHNSWTPPDYKNLSEEEVLKCSCTMSNFLHKFTS